MIFEAIVRWAVAFILGGVISAVGTFLKMRSVKERALLDGVQCLLRAEIIGFHERYRQLKYCPIYAKESLKRVYSAYHALGGNDVATGLYEKIMAFPENPDGESNI